MKKLLALLLAVAMLVTLCACGKKDKEGAATDDPKAVAQAFAKASPEQDYNAIFDLTVFDFEQYMKDSLTDQYGEEDTLFAELGEELDKDIDSWKDVYSAMLEEAKADLEDEYGSYKIKTKVTETVDLDEDEVQDIIEYLKDEWGKYIDEDKVEDISKAKDITVEITVKGEDDEETQTRVITVVKYDGEWKMADNKAASGAKDDDYDEDYDVSYDEDEYYDEYYDER